MPKYDALTKGKITSGRQCPKKLWFDVHQPIENKDKAVFRIGNLFGEQVRKNYAKGNGKFLDLTNEWADRFNRTKQAINSGNTNVIFEGAFQYLNTEVRTDVLIRKKKGWELLEAKSSTKLKPEHIEDIAIQSFIVRECMKQLGHDLISIRLIHVNRDFTFKKEGDYKGLIKDENDITEEINEKKIPIPNYIKDLIPLTNKNSPNPNIEMGGQCNKPYACDYQDRCKSLLPKSDITPFTVLPYIGKDKKLIEFMKSQGTIDLQKVPSKFFKDRKDYAPGYHKIIQEAHKKNEPWFSPNLKQIFKKFTFPLYFMDFETVGQVVPTIIGTTPYYPLPFLWSVCKWESKDKEIDKGKYFLKFNDQDIERQFIESLLKALGEKGTIFAHNATGTEIKILEKLKEKDSCKDLSGKIDNLINRVEDSAIIAKHNFYSPLMNGDWGIKLIIKAIPDSGVSYDEEDNIAGGYDAGLAWFIYTDPKTSNNDKEKQKKLLIDYCSKDTLAVYYLVKYLMEKTKVKKN